jgi:hypothetical protein
MRTYARWLFGTAAFFNFAVALYLLFVRHWYTSPLMPLAPTHGSNLVLANLAGALVGAFGYCYARVAGDPVKFRPYIHIGAIGKLLAVACGVVPALMGEVPPALPAAAVIDLVYAVLFFDYLRRTA